MSEQTDKLDKMLGVIRGLIANADDAANTDEAREAYRTKAEVLMLKYRVDEATLVASGQFGDGEGGLVPVWRTVALVDQGSEFATYYRTIGATVAQHVGARAATSREWNGQAYVLTLN